MRFRRHHFLMTPRLVRCRTETDCVCQCIPHNEQDEKVGQVIVDLMKSPIWDVRDTSLGFVARCFESVRATVLQSGGIARSHVMFQPVDRMSLPRKMLSSL